MIWKNEYSTLIHIKYFVDLPVNSSQMLPISKLHKRNMLFGYKRDCPSWNLASQFRPQIIQWRIYKVSLAYFAITVPCFCISLLGDFLFKILERVSVAFLQLFLLFSPFLTNLCWWREGSRWQMWKVSSVSEPSIKTSSLDQKHPLLWKNFTGGVPNKLHWWTSCLCWQLHAQMTPAACSP